MSDFIQAGIVVLAAIVGASAFAGPEVFLWVIFSVMGTVLIITLLNAAKILELEEEIGRLDDELDETDELRALTERLATADFLDSEPPTAEIRAIVDWLDTHPATEEYLTRQEEIR